MKPSSMLYNRVFDWAIAILVVLCWLAITLAERAEAWWNNWDLDYED